MASIASAALVLTTEASKLYSGMDEAKSKMKSFGEQGTGEVKKSFDGLKGASPWGQVFSAGQDIIEGTVDKLKELTNAGREAKALGVATEAFMGLTSAAKGFGMEGDEMFHMLVKFNEHTYKAGTGNKELGKTLGDLGINFSNLKNASPDQKFLAVAEALKGIQDPGQKAEAAMALFGKSGFKMLPFLDKGKEGIEAMMKKAKEMGVALSEADMSKLEAARSAIPKIGQVFEGMKNKLLVGFAPMIEKIGNGISKVIDWFMPLFDKASRAIVTWYTTLFEFYQELGEWILQAIQKVRDWLPEWTRVGSTTKTVENIVLNVMQKIGEGLGYLADITKAVGGLMALGFHPVLWSLDMILVGIKKALDGMAELTGSENKWGKALGEWHENFANFRKETDKWGINAVEDAFSGKSAAKVGAWFDKIRNRKVEVQIDPKINKGALDKIADDTKLGTLQAEGSSEAHKTEVEFQWQGMIKKENEQLKEAKEQNINLKKMQDTLNSINNRMMQPIQIGVV